MRLVTFTDDNGTRIGVHDAANDTIVDLAACTRLPTDMTSMVALGKSGIQRAKAGVKSGKGVIAVSSVKIEAPFPRPAKNILCVGKNYHEHAKEFHDSGFDASAKDAIPDLPIIFTKAPTSVVSPGEPITSWLDPTNSTDYEGELTVVIGKGGRGSQGGWPVPQHCLPVRVAGPMRLTHKRHRRCAGCYLCPYTKSAEYPCFQPDSRSGRRGFHQD